jgi:apolipoprotein N-acyltransferase
MWPYLISLLAGCFLTLAFAPFHFYGLAFLCPALLLFQWLHAPPRKSTLLGLLFGFGFFGTGSSWVFISLYRFGNAPFWLAIFLTICFVAILAAYFALQGFLLSRFFARRFPILFCIGIFPASWMLFEALRSTFFSGFPWLLLGYSQLDTPLRGFAPIIGVYGLTFLTTMISGFLVLLCRVKLRFYWQVSCIAFIFLSIGFGALLSKINWTTPHSKELKVRLIQGNVPQNLKWDAQQVLAILAKYKNLTNSTWQGDLTIWPEAAAPLFYQQYPSFFQNLATEMKNTHQSLLFGIPFLNEKNQKIYNGMMLIGQYQGQYLKRHLVPFGEYLPLPFLYSWLLNYFQIPLSDMSPGPQSQAPMYLGKIRLAPFICYEIAFPHDVLKAVKNTQLIVALVDDSWFGDSIALDQHLQISQMRALETGRYLLLTTNTGITAVINPRGEVVSRAPIDQPYVLTAAVQPMTGNTPLMAWGYYPIFIISILLLFIALI